MTKKIEKLTNFKLKTNKNRLHQGDARKYKELLHNVMIEKLSELENATITEIQNAIILELEHTDLGAIVIEAKFVIKPLDFDVITASDEFLEKQEKAKKSKE